MLPFWSCGASVQSCSHPHAPPDRQNRIQNQHPRSITSRLCQLYLSSTTVMPQPKLIVQKGTYSVASKVSAGSNFQRKRFDRHNFPLHLRHPECTVKLSSHLAQIPLYLFLNKCKTTYRRVPGLCPNLSGCSGCSEGSGRFKAVGSRSMPFWAGTYCTTLSTRIF